MITVIDTPFSEGRDWAIEQFFNNPDKQYIYATPFVKEILTIRDCTEDRRDFCLLHECDSKYQVFGHQFADGKIHALNECIEKGEDVAVTYSTFAKANNETMQLLKKYKPVLVLDDTTNFLVDYNEMQRIVHGKKIHPDDIRLLIDGGFISIDDLGRIHWISDNSCRGTAYDKIERFARGGNLMFIDNRLLVWAFPTQILQCFDEIYILTYFFETTHLKEIIDELCLHYEKKSVRKNDDGDRYELCEFIPQFLTQYSQTMYSRILNQSYAQSTD